jgi:saccharopine dehydrogenase (NAD+, L-lysine forming)
VCLENNNLWIIKMGNNSEIKTIWLRSESRATERRTPLLAAGAKELMADGYNVVVERSENRIIDNSEYEAAGCEMVDAGGWMNNPPADALILGLKELPDEPAVINNHHILFAHAYKEQAGWKETLTRFVKGGADLLDIEYMTLENGMRYVAFGYRAGYMGAALSLLHWFSKQDGNSYLDKPLQPFNDADILDETIESLSKGHKKPKVLIIGAGGRCGTGAADVYERHGAIITRWDYEDTQNIDRDALGSHDIMINCAFIKGKTSPFIRKQDIKDGARLSIVTDVGCDPFSDFNPVPIYSEPTSWDKAYVKVSGDSDKSVDLIAIDNLPSLLPRESSEEFAELMLPHLKVLKSRENEQPWTSAKASFDDAVERMNNS